MPSLLQAPKPTTPNFNGAYNPVSSGTMSTLMGIKPKAPGTINTTQNSTLKSSNVAPPDQQKAGGPTNAGAPAPTNPTPQPLTGNVTTPSGTVVNAGTGLIDPSFQGTMANLITSAIRGSQSAPSYNAQTAQYGAQNIPIANKAQGVADRANSAYHSAINDLTQSRLNEAKSLGAIGSSPIPLEFQQGRAAVLQGQYQAQQDAYAQQANAATNLYSPALQGALTAEQQAANATNAATGQALTGQQLQQTGLTSAAGLIPKALRYSGSSLDPSVISQSYAQQVQRGLMSPQDAQSAMNSLYEGAGATFLNQALAGSGYNYNVGAGNAAAQQQNTTALGTAGVNAPLSVYQQQLQQLGQSQVAASQIAQFGNQLIETMSQPAAQGGLGINPYSSQYANEKLNQLKTQFSDPQYATFNTNIAGLQARVANLLQTGEIPTAATAGAQAIVSGNATLAAMKATLDQIDREAGAITGSQAQVASTAYQQAQSAAGGGSGGNSDPLGIR